MRHAIIMASIAIALAGCKTNQSALVGIYDNGMEGFKSSSMILSSCGYGAVMTSVSGMLGPWNVINSEGNSYVHMHWTDCMDDEIHELDALFLLNKERRTLALAGTGGDLKGALAAARALPAERLLNQEMRYNYVTNAIPQKYEKAFADFPAELEKMKRRAAARKRQKEEEAARARKEQPVYEACLAEIKADPRKILTIPFVFYQEGEEPKFLKGRAKRTPEVRAVMDALGDKTIKFPEDVLLSFLDRYEWNSYFYVIAPVFVRDELTAESRRKLHPRMRDYAEHLDGERAGTFYEHKNTPIDLVRDACGWKGSGWFSDALNRRLKCESESASSEDANSDRRVQPDNE